MNKTDTKKAVFLRHFLNGTERLAQTILYRKPFNGLMIEPDVKYAGDSKYEVADLIYPAENAGGKKLPIMIYIHGGGWVSGVKNMRRTYCYEYAKKGYFVANIDYDWSPLSQFPVPVEQCLKAVDYIYDNAEKYNLDTDKLFLAGESAGGYFVAMLAAISKDKSILDKLGIKMKHTEFDVKVNLLNCGALDLLSMAKGKFPNMGLMLHSFTDMTPDEILHPENYDRVALMSPITYINSEFPPTYMLYATHDDLRHDTFALKKIFDNLGVENGMYKCDGALYGNHAFAVSTVTPKGREILKHAQAFVNKYIFTDKVSE